jgi:hypothetical protein
VTVGGAGVTTCDAVLVSAAINMRIDASELRWHMPLAVAFNAGTLDCEINDPIDVGGTDPFEAFPVDAATRMRDDSFEFI